jgi:hypothetical protein
MSRRSPGFVRPNDSQVLRLKPRGVTVAFMGPVIRPGGHGARDHGRIPSEPPGGR